MDQKQLKTPEKVGENAKKKKKKKKGGFRSHTTSIQSGICFKADSSQLIYLHSHFSFEESLTASEEHARYTLTDGHPLPLKKSKCILTVSI